MAALARRGVRGDGAYVVVRDGGRTYAARAPIRETYHEYVDPEGVLRTDHALRIWSAPYVCTTGWSVAEQTGALSSDPPHRTGPSPSLKSGLGPCEGL